MARTLALSLLLVAATAQAGTLGGQVVDEDSGEPLAGVTILVQGTEPRQSAITDEAGHWEVGVAGGEAYHLTYYYLSTSLESRRVWVGRTSTTHVQQLFPREEWAPGSCEVGLPIPTSLPVTVGAGSWEAIADALARGVRPPVAAVRIEELLNHVPYSLTPPSDPKQLAITTEVGPTPWNDATKLMRVVLHASPMAPGLVAHDVTLEVEQNDDRVAHYRLLGYETDKTAGSARRAPGASIGAGHTITALYEVTPTEGAEDVAASTLFFVRARYTTPDQRTRVLRHTVTDRDVLLSDTTIDFHFAAALAGFGMLLAQTPDRADLDWNTVALLAKRGVGTNEGGRRRPLLALIQQARWLQL
jgi:hypothetical protein